MKSLYSNHANSQIHTPFTDAKCGTQTCTHVDGCRAQSQSKPPKCMHNDGSMNIKTREVSV